ncbi:hypothetical protein QFZ34_001498 [Phyllobacterium ifriqiyense]|uniref:Uncharacterized protein n=1 Tax=Phyllobacterium ifriqiyense TaxID=314238 RepID=A0ABU0S733_9HYPH|nr:hypothetical protein [Phyllobacterium ifriqiyense]
MDTTLEVSRQGGAGVLVLANGRMRSRRGLFRRVCVLVYK